MHLLESVGNKMSLKEPKFLTDDTPPTYDEAIRGKSATSKKNFITSFNIPTICTLFQTALMAKLSFEPHNRQVMAAWI